MKKAKTFAILGATALSLGILSTSIAMYVKTPTSKTVNIGGTYVTNGYYTLTDASSSGLLSPNTPVTITTTLGLSANNGYYTQKSVLGKIGIEFDFGTEEFADLVTVEAKINGYVTGNYFANNNTFTFAEDTEDASVISSEYTTAFAVDGTNTLEITISVTEGMEEDFLTYAAEKSYSYTISLTEPGDEYEVAYVVGSIIGWSAPSAYEMVPDLTTTDGSYTWVYEGYVVTDDEELKAVKGETWSGGDNYEVNLTYLESEGYTAENGVKISWNGNSGVEDGIVVTPITTTAGD